MMQPVEQILLQTRLHAAHWHATLTAKTADAPKPDLRELLDWFTGPEKELTLRCSPFNLFFHPLPSGNYALGLIYPAQQDQTFDVRTLLIPPQVLLEAGNHPIALFESVPQLLPPPAQPSPLAPLVLPAAFPKINSDLLENLLNSLGALSLAHLIQSLFNAECTLFTSKSVSALSVLSVLFDLLPIQYRPELTFSSDFFFTPKNSFRLSGFSKLQQRTVRLMKQWGVPVISLERGNKGSMETLDPWPRFVYQLLQTQNFAFLNEQWNHQYQSAARSPLGLEPIMWDNLHEVGVSLSKAMLLGALPEKHVSATECSTHTLEELRCVAAVDQMIPMLDGPRPYTARPVSDQRLGDRFPQFREELSELEMYMSRSMFGDESAEPNLRRIWTQLLPRLASETKESIQESVISLYHTVLISLDGSTSERLQRSARLLELMMFFLDPQETEP
ncbi:MAG: hypothetical protein FWG73_08680 [Planctomycetaceae bacterium]|nr:hypothetical protein [Planctomycetaceae bacterium]